MNAPRDDWRRRTVAALGQRLESESFPRSTVTLLLFVTGLLGFLASVVMLRLGLHAMWLRYPLAVAVAYLAFLVMLRIWAGTLWRVLREEHVPAPEEVIAPPALRPEKRRKSEGRWHDWLDVPDVGLGVVGGCLPFVAVAVLVGAVAALVAVVVAAPALAAEVFLDAFLVAALYKRLRRVERRHWFVTAVRRTWLPAACAAGGLALAGWAMQLAVPEAISIGPVFHHLFSGSR